MQYDWGYCACSVSAFAEMLQLTDIIPFEMGCWEMMQLGKQMGRWRDASYNPLPGDIIFFDWANKKDGAPDHVGVVKRVENGIVYTIEGNCNGGKVDDQQHPKNDPQILGYIAPDYSRGDIPTTKKYRVTTGLYLREKPTVLSKYICVMPKDAIVEWLGEQEGKWMKVNYNGKIGWCSGNYLEEVK